MCLLSYYEAGIIPDTERLCNGAQANADGHGYAIATRAGRLITGHGMSSARVIAEFAELRKQHHDGPALFHSRFSTGGRLDEGNCHPYQVGRDRKTVLAHNGVLFHVKPGESRSDTRIFAERIMPGQYVSLDRPRTRARLEGYLGKFNKIAVITVNPRYRHQGYLFNEKAGVRLPDGEWHSNHDFKPFTYTYGHYPVTTVVGGKAVAPPRYRRSERLDCDSCEGFESVDEVTLICSLCLSCWDCGMPSEQDEEGNVCQCYLPLKERKRELAAEDRSDQSITWEQYVRLRDGEEASLYKEELAAGKVKPDTITFSTALVPLPRVPAATGSSLTLRTARETILRAMPEPPAEAPAGSEENEEEVK